MLRGVPRACPSLALRWPIYRRRDCIAEIDRCARIRDRHRLTLVNLEFRLSESGSWTSQSQTSLADLGTSQKHLL